MRVSAICVLTGALVWGCSSDDNQKNLDEPLAHEGLSVEEEANPGALAEVSTDEGSQEGTEQAGDEGAWQDTAGQAASVAMEAARESTGEGREGNLMTTPVATFAVKASTLNVRSGPGTNHAKTRTLHKGETVSAVEQAGTWVRIGDKEWVSTSFLTKVPQGS